LAPGNYVFTTTYEILRKGPRAGAACELNINGSGPSSATQGPDVAGSVAVPTQQTAAMSSTRHLKHAATAKLQCAGNGNGKATLFNISIIALKFPKLTVHRVLSPKR
jgi:hypothetical protein